MKKNILKILALIIITLNVGATVVFADNSFVQSTIPKPSTLPGPTITGSTPANDNIRNTLITQVLPRFAVILIGSTASLALVFLIVAGVRFATAYGNDEVIQKAKKQATYAIVGLLISLMAYTIVTIVSNFNYTEFNPSAIPNAPSNTN